MIVNCSPIYDGGQQFHFLSMEYSNYTPYLYLSQALFFHRLLEEGDFVREGGSNDCVPDLLELLDLFD